MPLSQPRVPPADNATPNLLVSGRPDFSSVSTLKRVTSLYKVPANQSLAPFSNLGEVEGCGLQEARIWTPPDDPNNVPNILSNFEKNTNFNQFMASQAEVDQARYSVDSSQYDLAARNFAILSMPFVLW